MSDIKDRPIKPSADGNDWVAVHPNANGLGDEKRVKGGLIGVYADMAAFNAAGGASVLGDGTYNISGSLYTVKSGIFYKSGTRISNEILEQEFPVTAAYDTPIAPGLLPAWTFSGSSNNGALVDRSTVPGLPGTGYALKLETLGNGICRANRNVMTAPGIDATLAAESVFVVAVWLPAAMSTLNKITMTLFDGTNSPAYAYQQSGWKPGLNHIVLEGSLFSPALNGDQTYNRIELDTGAGGGAATAYILSIRHFRKAAVIKSFNALTGKITSNFSGRFMPRIIFEYDDAWGSVYNIAFPLHKERNIVGSIAVIRDKVGTAGYCTESQLLEMKLAGWELTVHGNYNHGSILTTYQQIYDDVKFNQDYIKALGGNAYSYIYPGGSYVEGISDAALKALGFYSGRTTSTLNDLVNGVLGDERPYFSKAFTMNNANYSSISGYVTRAIKSCSTLRLYGHKVAATVTDTTLEISTANLTTLLDLAVTNRRAGLMVDCNVSDFETAFGIR